MVLLKFLWSTHGRRSLLHLATSRRWKHPVLQNHICECFIHFAVWRGLSPKWTHTLRYTCDIRSLDSKFHVYLGLLERHYSNNDPAWRNRIIVYWHPTYFWFIPSVSSQVYGIRMHNNHRFFSFVCGLCLKDIDTPLSAFTWINKVYLIDNLIGEKRGGYSR